MRKLFLAVLILSCVSFAQRFYVQDSLQTVLTGLRSATSSLNTEKYISINLI